MVRNLGSITTKPFGLKDGEYYGVYLPMARKFCLRRRTCILRGYSGLAAGNVNKGSTYYTRAKREYPLRRKISWP